MPAVVRPKAGSLKDPDVAALFSTKDPESRYIDLREVGRGSFGEVYFAQDRETNETVAIKKMSYVGKDAYEKWRDIIKEVRFIRQVRHANIVEYRASFLKEQTCWLIMEYCIGSASDIINVFKEQLVEDAIAEICDQTLSALVYIHSLQHIHRDLKAGNILITDTGVVKLGDLGSSSLKAPANSFVGSPFWISPEVILAMDDGEYGTKADIWSLGITCIELANRRPPLYDLNTMSALYHIAQNKPPALARTHPQYSTVKRSDNIISFVQQCLIKDPTMRPSAEECKQHAFLRRKRKDAIMIKLVRRTKKRVRRLDNDMYTRMKKLFYLDAPRVASASLSSSSSEEEDECFVSEPRQSSASTQRSSFKHTFDADENGLDVLVANPPHIGAIKSSHIVETLSSESDSTMTETQSDRVCIEQNGNLAKRQIDDLNGKPSASLPTSAASSQRLQRNRTVISVNEGIEDAETSALSPLALPDETQPELQKRHIDEEINTLKRSKFSTLRTTKLITKEMEEARRENNAKEQMSGYQRLRQHHQRELLHLEERCKFEAELTRQRHEKEYEQCLLAAQREINKLRAANTLQLEKKARENEEYVRKLRKSRLATHEQQLKTFVAARKREYKHNKEHAKRQLKQRGMRKSSYEEAVKGAKHELMAAWAKAEAEYVAKQNSILSEAVSELRQQCQNEFLCLEQRLLAAEHAARTRQLEAIETMLIAHHNAAKEQAIAHFKECAQMKKRHLQVQHSSELTNQSDYTKRMQDDTRKLHALKQKHLPKELKVKEAAIKKQFRQTVKTQARQYKMLHAQMLQGVSKEEQKEVSARLKQEQARKIAGLAVQYDSNIKTMMLEQTVQLDSTQEEEQRKLNDRLGGEMSLLLEFQQRQKESLDTTCAREAQSLSDAWDTKKAVLQKKIDEDRVRFESERAAQLKKLDDEQANELAKISSAQNGGRNGSRSRTHSKSSERRVMGAESMASNTSTPRLSSAAAATPTSTTASTASAASALPHSRSTSNSARSSPSHQSTNL